MSDQVKRYVFGNMNSMIAFLEDADDIEVYLKTRPEVIADEIIHYSMADFDLPRTEVLQHVNEFLNEKGI